MAKRLETLAEAPDFELKDTQGRTVRLSDFRGKQPVVLVMTRGFIWPYCRAHLAQLRQDIDKFTARGAVILTVGPDGPNAFRKYWEENDMPFTGLADLRSRVASRYEQEVNLFKFGRMPALFVIDTQGTIRFAHYGDSMSDIPPNETVLAVLDQINEEAERVSWLFA